MARVICVACDKPYAEFSILPDGTVRFTSFPNGTNLHLFDVDKHSQYVLGCMHHRQKS